ncbi:hypothetical protein BDV98DRAFT_578129, partial [Pterulicium gracile]
IGTITRHSHKAMGNNRQQSQADGKEKLWRNTKERNRLSPTASVRHPQPLHHNRWVFALLLFSFPI